MKRGVALDRQADKKQDVINGQLYHEMNLKSSDLAILVHSDGAKISKSTFLKLFLCNVSMCHFVCGSPFGSYIAYGLAIVHRKTENAFL